jgi:hypothetical protein
MQLFETDRLLLHEVNSCCNESSILKKLETLSLWKNLKKLPFSISMPSIFSGKNRSAGRKWEVWSTLRHRLDEGESFQLSELFKNVLKSSGKSSKVCSHSFRI